MDKSILEIIKDKDDYRTVVEIKENAKGEPQISVKVRDNDGVIAMKQSLLLYKKTKEELSK